VDLAFSASSDNIGVAGYTVYRDGVPLVGLPAGTQTYSDTGVLPSTTYQYTVDAFDAAGNHSAQSAPVAAATLADTQPPSIPAGLSVTGLGPNQVNLTWSASTDNIGVSGYAIFRDEAPLATVEAPLRNYTDTTVFGATTYVYTVAAFDEAGNQSLESAGLSVTTPAGGSPPITPSPAPTATATPTPTPSPSPSPSPTPTPSPLVTGFRGCNTTAAVTSGSGDNNGYETNPANACGDGLLNAVDTNSGTGPPHGCQSTTKDRHVFRDYGFTVPPATTILGIEIRIDAWADSALGNPRVCVQLSWNGGLSWTAEQTTPVVGTSQSTYMLGGASDNWGRTWNPADLSNANFRIRVTNRAQNSNRDFSLEWVAAQVTYRP
jgi:chitodextrinase